jgi:hypothetical protein
MDLQHLTIAELRHLIQAAVEELTRRGDAAGAGRQHPVPSADAARADQQGPAPAPLEPTCQIMCPQCHLEALLSMEPRIGPRIE